MVAATFYLLLTFFILTACFCFAISAKGFATRNDGNEQNHSQANTKLFRLLLDLPHKHDDTPVAQRDGNNTMLMFCC